ncbi:DUF624 domain-containing protein [Mesobacillus foraminis]|uniref:YesL family protein n=1 Tax=Mesobacillus foraminis TaxID=279826 RepID=UPI001BE94E80|nr:DUF624 domain-containing protein [Mesobacillus foraminis]MBT2757813.1 DUF624 domain-containing protein [Mesobacillus foraminis]
MNLWGNLYRVCEWITRFASLNLIWLLFNLPVILLTINLFNVHSLSQVTQTLMIIGILIPLVFFPATTAMFAVVRKWVIKEDISTFKMYLTYYKENYVRSLNGGILILFFWVSFILYSYTFYQHMDLSLLIFILPFAVLTIFTLHFFSITAHFDVRLLASLKHAFFITIGSPLLTLGISLITGLILFLSIKTITFLIPFFVGPLIAYSSFLGFYAHLMKVEARKVKFQEGLYS